MEEIQIIIVLIGAIINLYIPNKFADCKYLLGYLIGSLAIILG